MRCCTVQMQMKIVKRLLQRISKVPRMLAPEMRVVVSVGRVQDVEKVEAEARLAARGSPIARTFESLKVIASLDFPNSVGY